MNRRDFFTGAGACAGVAAAAGAATFSQLSQGAQAVKENLHSGLNEMGARIDQLTSRVKQAESRATACIGMLAADLEVQRLQIKLIFFLLLVSFAIDGGLSLSLIGGGSTIPL